jgi:hypothetical protein
MGSPPLTAANHVKLTLVHDMGVAARFAGTAGGAYVVTAIGTERPDCEGGCPESAA